MVNCVLARKAVRPLIHTLTTYINLCTIIIPSNWLNLGKLCVYTVHTFLFSCTSANNNQWLSWFSIRQFIRKNENSNPKKKNQRNETKTNKQFEYFIFSFSTFEYAISACCGFRGVCDMQTEQKYTSEPMLAENERHENYFLEFLFHFVWLYLK